jgi:biotin carboxylase
MNEMRVLVLGAGHSQINAIRRLKESGHTVIVSDYYLNPPGKAIADFHEAVSTFDAEGNIAVARKHRVEAVLTLGTDQPVYTAARVAEALGLPAPLPVATARAVTNKQVMKEWFTSCNLPTVAFRLIGRDFRDAELTGLRFPVVVKPLDSQGQRGVFKLDSAAEIRSRFGEVLSFSREERILVEEYYPGREITVSGWVIDGVVHTIAVVDRISRIAFPYIGICVRHRYPSEFLAGYHREILTLNRKITDGFQIKDGPIYFQMLIGTDGIKINEIACRLGGAYEDEYLAEATGIDLLGMLFDTAMGKKVDPAPLESCDFTRVKKRLSVELFFARPGLVASLNDMEQLKCLPGVIRARHFQQPGDRIGMMENATARAGYVIVAGDDEASLARNLERVYEQLAVRDGNGANMVLRFGNY